MRDWNFIRKPVWIKQQHITEMVDITRQLLSSARYPNLEQKASSILWPFNDTTKISHLNMKLDIRPSKTRNYFQTFLCTTWTETSKGQRCPCFSPSDSFRHQTKSVHAVHMKRTSAGNTGVNKSFLRIPGTSYTELFGYFNAVLQILNSQGMF
jgi:hypothetical protein